MRLRKVRWLMILALLALVVGACGNSSSADTDSDADHEVVAADSEETQDEPEADHDESEADHDESEADHDESEADHDESEADQDASEADHDEFEADHDHGEDGHHEAAFAFGTPAEASEADRVISVEATDGLTFGPDAFEVSAGETIEFVVTNTGAIPHDFTLGDQEAQEAHAEEMAEGGMEHNDPNAVVLEPGETKSLTWTFTETGTVLIGCHQPGHYDGGMTGTVEVTA